MRAFIGTSGFSYTEWKGVFYPSDIKPKQMLAFYASHLPSVEINATFYRMPQKSMLEGWRDQVPESFRFVLKASRRITHQKKLEDCGETLTYMLDVARLLGDKLGPILFQLPPFFKKDVERLAAFLELVPKDVRAAFEFRHASWFSDDTYDVLRRYDVALCGGDLDDERKSPPLVPTASFGYLRLRRADYTRKDLEDWAERIHAQGQAEVFGFFKHEELGPTLASRLIEVLEGAA